MPSGWGGGGRANFSERGLDSNLIPPSLLSSSRFLAGSCCLPSLCSITCISKHLGSTPESVKSQ